MKISKFLPALFSLAFLLASCGPSQKIPEAKPLPAGASFAGVWFSKQFEHMYLRQSGDQVNGIYAYKNGGTLEGTANGNVLEFTWIDPGDKETARRRFEGKGFLVMTREGESLQLQGEWGYNDSYTGGGPWEAEYIRPMDPEDPRSLDELDANR